MGSTSAFVNARRAACTLPRECGPSWACRGCSWIVTSCPSPHAWPPCRQTSARCSSTVSTFLLSGETFRSMTWRSRALGPPGSSVAPRGGPSRTHRQGQRQAVSRREGCFARASTLLSCPTPPQATGVKMTSLRCTRSSASVLARPLPLRPPRSRLPRRAGHEGALHRAGAVQPASGQARPPPASEPRELLHRAPSAAARLAPWPPPWACGKARPRATRTPSRSPTTSCPSMWEGRASGQCCRSPPRSLLRPNRTLSPRAPRRPSLGPLLLQARQVPQVPSGPQLLQRARSTLSEGKAAPPSASAAATATTTSSCAEPRPRPRPTTSRMPPPRRRAAWSAPWKRRGDAPCPPPPLPGDCPTRRYP
mmetsp:Transcript_2710/g.10841  ORF Transcript_2710/g.10841 Transcript_2710/m.10841 type:complete len:365 (+) Transcript_2710:8150-9244(+)